MNNPWKRTGAYLGGAAILTILALATRPGAVDSAFFSEKGELFFPSFTDPSQAASLEVVTLDESGTALENFVVEKKDGKWTIPSHYGYAADAEERMGKAAALFVGLLKQGVRSDNPGDHVRFGVIDPTDERPEAEGRGQKVTFKDSAGNQLATLILGNKAERDGTEKNARFVRVPDKKRVYTAEIPEELSTAFDEWIETDLLKLQSWDIEKLVFDNHTIDEARGVVVPGDKVELAKKEFKWALEGMAEGEEFTEDKVRDATSELGQIKIVGVRPKPEGITGRLETARGFEAQRLVDVLVSRGFYPVRSGAIKSDEGELVAVTNKGVRYTLRFGQVVYGTARELSAGTEGEGSEGEGTEGTEGAEGSEGEKAPEGLKPNRYLMVSVDFDESAILTPDQPALDADVLANLEKARDLIEEINAALTKYQGAHEDKFPPTLAALSEGEGAPLGEVPKDPWNNDFLYNYDEATNTYVLLALGSDGVEGGEGAEQDLDSTQLDRVAELRKVSDDWKEVETKREEGREEVAKLQKRFEPWYYVIDATSFDKLKVKRADVVKAAEAGPPAPGGGEESTGNGGAEEGGSGG